MPSSLIVVALVVAWLAVLVPMVVRKRQEIAKTADSALTARVVRSGNAEEPEAEEPELAGDGDRAHPAKPPRAYRPGRGGFDPQAAAISARAKYAFRQRVVFLLILGAIVSGVIAGALFPLVWWGHGALDIVLAGYLAYLRRQVRVEEAIRVRRLARMSAARRAQAPLSRVAEVEEHVVEEEPDEGTGQRALVSDGFGAPPPQSSYPNAVVVDVDDEDPIFDELEQPDNLPYRRAAGE